MKQRYYMLENDKDKLNKIIMWDTLTKDIPVLKSKIEKCI